MNNINYSIIIPHHNIPSLLQRCLDSIPQRTDTEIIIVDDNSSPQIVDFSQFPGYNRCDVTLIFDKRGKGGGYARNIGLKRAKGTWIIFSDADDLFTKDFNSTLDYYTKDRADVIFFNVDSVLSNNLSIKSYRTKDNLFEEYSQTKESTIFRLKYTEPWGKFIKRSLILQHNIKFDEVPVSNDYYFSIQIGCVANEIKIVNKKIYMVTTRKDSVSFQFGDSLEKILIRLDVAIKVQCFERLYGYNIKPMPIRELMILLLKKSPICFFKKLIIIYKKRISLPSLFIQMLLPKFKPRTK